MEVFGELNKVLTIGDIYNIGILELDLIYLFKVKVSQVVSYSNDYYDNF